MKKEKPSKKRSEHAWNPKDCWQLLRRNENYKQAVNDVIEEAKKSGDKVFLEAYEYLSRDSAGGTRSRANKFNNHKEALERWAIYSDNLFTISNRRIFAKPARKKAAINFSSQYFQKFAALYGDIIHFPINPATRMPYVQALSSVWALSPVKTIPLNFMNHLDENNRHTLLNSNLRYLTIVINPRFHSSVIASELASLIKNETDRADLLTAKMKWEDDEFQRYLRIYDLHLNRDSNGRHYGYLRIGKECAPDDVKKRGEEAIKSWAKKKLLHVKSVLSIFDGTNKRSPFP